MARCTLAALIVVGKRSEYCVAPDLSRHLYISAEDVLALSARPHITKIAKKFIKLTGIELAEKVPENNFTIFCFLS